MFGLSCMQNFLFIVCYDLLYFFQIINLKITIWQIMLYPKKNVVKLWAFLFCIIFCISYLLIFIIWLFFVCFKHYKYFLKQKNVKICLKYGGEMLGSRFCRMIQLVHIHTHTHKFALIYTYVHSMCICPGSAPSPFMCSPHICNTQCTKIHYMQTMTTG